MRQRLKMIEFERASSFALGSYIRVIMIVETLPSNGWFKKQRKLITRNYKGWITVGPGAEHQYFESRIQAGKQKFSDSNLDLLKEKICSYLEPKEK